ncbi:MAG: integration host factor subunit beta [Nitrospinae bacterium]|nr:integration host factor subunit beta [Nitrospinota bacterium]
MRREHLVNLLKRKTGATRKEANDIVDLFFNSIKDALKDGDRVELRGFGSFSLRKYNDRMGRNPKTGEAIKITPKNKPFFKTGKELKEKINQGS